VRYAGILRRLGAMTIDVAIGWIAYAIAITVLDPNAGSENATTRETVLALVIILAVLGLWFSYFVISERLWGQTLGKRALGIRVSPEAGRRLSWGRALLRNLVLAIDVVVAPFLIPLSARRQRLGDRLAHTVVLVNWDEAAGTAGEGGGAGADQPVGAALGAGGSVPPPGASPTPVRPTGAGATWGPGRVGVGILVLLIASLVEVAIVSVFDPSLDSLGARLAAQALLAATLVAVAFGTASDRRGGWIPAWTMGLRRPLRSPFPVAGAAYLAYIVFALLYSTVVNPHQRDITRDLGFGHGDIGTIAAGILIIGAAPISEEIFFRGFIFGGFRKRLSFPIAGLLSALIFGIFHYTGAGSIGVVPQLAFLGFALSWVYERTGSIYPTIALHMLNNAFAFIYLTS
jgi:membrane protease YdiL (CAAX protease family)